MMYDDKYHERSRDNVIQNRFDLIVPPYKTLFSLLVSFQIIDGSTGESSVP